MARRNPKRARVPSVEAAADRKPADAPVLPKGGVDKLHLGASFAEYDAALSDRSIYVFTPAYAAAENFTSGKYFFVGRRGTGKTALRRHIEATAEHAHVVVPEIFSPTSLLLDVDLFVNSAKKPFRSLVSAFKRTIASEILFVWSRAHPNHIGLDSVLEAEIAEFSGFDFDSRALRYITNISRPLARGDEQGWLGESKKSKKLIESMKDLHQPGQAEYSLLIDSIDDFWEGTDESLVYLTAFMHACLEVSSQLGWARAVLFLRENIFERIRARDSESSRLETAVVGLDWSTPQLFEMVERRLNRPFNTKFALGGRTWDAWFEQPDAARAEVMTYCQRRPRDVLTYVSHAIENAQGDRHKQVMLDDLQAARRRFSDNRLRDLGDEYAENYPQLAVVLSRFYGLGTRYTVGGAESLLRKLQSDGEVIKLCGRWIFDEAGSIERFVRMLYNIGFLGIAKTGSPPKFRGLGPQDTTPPPVSDAVDLVIHKCYWDALDLQDVLVRDVPADSEFGRAGIISELPGGMDTESYLMELDDLADRLTSLPTGTDAAADFEVLVGDIIRLCFFRALENVEPRSRDAEGRVIRDWIAANRAQSGFWELIRTRYQAMQVIWECKNYADLKADDFHQASYYLNEASGRFVVMAFRGKEISSANFGHVKRILMERRGLVLPLTERDLSTFIRQARNGKIKEDHIQERYDHVLRRIG